MVPIARYSLDDPREGESMLLHDGVALQRVPGIVLEAQYSLGSRDLVLTSQDVPYEESLAVMLLEGGRVIDRLTLSSGPLAGISFFSDARIEGPDTLSFTFWRARGCVTVLPRKAWRGLGFGGPVWWWPRVRGYLTYKETPR